MNLKQIESKVKKLESTMKKVGALAKKALKATQGKGSIRSLVKLTGIIKQMKKLKVPSKAQSKKLFNSLTKALKKQNKTQKVKALAKRIKKLQRACS